MIKTPLSTVIGGAFWTPGCTVIGGNTPTFDQQIQKLFANGEQGFFYDPNDLSTMFQDAAGTVPVTAVGQPVGLVLDKSKGLTLGANYLNTDTLDFTTGWSASAAVTTKSKLSFTTNATGGCYKNSVIPVGKTAKIRLVGTCSVSWVFRNANDNNGVINVPAGAFDITSNNAALFSTATSIYFSLNLAGTIAIDSISIQELKGNHAYQTTSASRPILRKNAVTGANYLEFDGSDDFLQTANIDFTTTDKLSLFTGVRKLSDTNAQMLVELSADQTANSGSFVLMPRQTGIAEGASFRSRGSLYNSILNVAGLKAPLSTVFTAKADIQGDSSILRSNGVQVGELNADQGTGNYGNYPLYIGRRGGTALPFNGHIYGLIGIGKLASDSETAAIEKELAKRTGVTLNV